MIFSASIRNFIYLTSINIFSFSRKIGSVGPVNRKINLVSPYAEFPVSGDVVRSNPVAAAFHSVNLQSIKLPYKGIRSPR